MKVLCVAPRFAPINAADSHRLRLLVPYLHACGWCAEILTVDHRDVPGPQDPWLQQQLPQDLALHPVRAWPMRGWGLNGLAQRSFVPLYRRGASLLATGGFDLVFFSTTEFLLHGLGPLWQQRFGVPFCMDLQDPWVNDYYREHPQVRPPGGRFKYGVADQVHRLAERAVMRRCAGVLSVSPDYLQALNQRYGAAVTRQAQRVDAFPCEPNELAALGEARHAENHTPGDTRVWRYIGRGGADMATAASAFFTAWQSAMGAGQVPPSFARFEAIGTSYAPRDRAAKTLAPLAKQAGLSASVQEITERLGYSDMLRALLASDALVIFGSDDASYTASKIFPYLLAGKPLLAIFHERSPAVPLIHAIGGAVLVTYNSETSAHELANAILRAWFENSACDRAIPLDRAALEPYTAQAQAQRVAHWFDGIVHGPH